MWHTRPLHCSWISPDVLPITKHHLACMRSDAQRETDDPHAQAATLLYQTAWWKIMKNSHRFPFPNWSLSLARQWQRKETEGTVETCTVCSFILAINLVDASCIWARMVNRMLNRQVSYSESELSSGDQKLVIVSFHSKNEILCKMEPFHSL